MFLAALSYFGCFFPLFGFINLALKRGETEREREIIYRFSQEMKAAFTTNVTQHNRVNYLGRADDDASSRFFFTFVLC